MWSSTTAAGATRVGCHVAGGRWRRRLLRMITIILWSDDNYEEDRECDDDDDDNDDDYDDNDDDTDDNDDEDDDSDDDDDDDDDVDDIDDGKDDKDDTDANDDSFLRVDQHVRCLDLVSKQQLFLLWVWSEGARKLWEVFFLVKYLITWKW